MFILTLVKINQLPKWFPTLYYLIFIQFVILTYLINIMFLQLINYFILVSFCWFDRHKPVPKHSLWCDFIRASDGEHCLWNIRLHLTKPSIIHGVLFLTYDALNKPTCTTLYQRQTFILILNRIWICDSP